MLIPPPHTQEVTFNNGTKLTLRNVEKIEAGNWFHIVANGGKEYITNPANILFVKVYRENKTDYEKKS
ncbi:MAG: hypothetical protein M0R06_10655 [Sphaerochaeta sp.]|jgi:hypothetical protein|nr:hypothetical protein [Sphaerochaeta sp.]